MPDPGEIVVTGRPYYGYGVPSWYSTTPTSSDLSNFPGGYPYPGGSVYQYVYDYYKGPYDTSKAEIQVELDVILNEAEKAAINYLKDVLGDVRDFAKLPGFSDKVAVDANGVTVTGYEAKNLINSIDMLVTNDIYLNGGTGETDVTTSNWVVGNHDVLLKVNIQGITGWMGVPYTNGSFVPNVDKALTYFAHELGHATAAGQALNASLNVGGLTAAEWMQNEQFAYSAGKAILDMAGITTPGYTPIEGYGSPFTIFP